MPTRDATMLLKEDHAKAKKLLEALLATTERAGRKRRDLVESIKTELQTHMQLEEQIFYPALKESSKSKEVQRLYYEAVEEHHAADTVLADLMNADPGGPNFSGKAKVLKELVLHHIQEEEKEIFPQARKHLGKEELRELGERLMERKREIQGGLRTAAE